MKHFKSILIVFIYNLYFFDKNIIFFDGGPGFEYKNSHIVIIDLQKWPEF